MCQFVSWIEYDENKEYFLKDSDLRGKKFNEYKKYNSRWYDDIMGHGAIRYFYPELGRRGKDLECTNFSTPDNFPKKIVQAIKAGRMSKFGLSLELLNEKGKIKYEKIVDPAWAEYEKIRKSALAEYEKIKRSAWAEYEKIKRSAFWKLFAEENYRNPEWI